MGGWGSKRWAGYARRTQVEESLRLDINAIFHHPPGTVLTLRWGDANQIRLIRIEGGARLVYQRAESDERVRERISILQHTSGRWYWICPECDRQAGILYKPFNRLHFRCRQCHDLTYRRRQIHRRYQSLARHMAGFGYGISVREWNRILESDG